MQYYIIAFLPGHDTPYGITNPMTREVSVKHSILFTAALVCAALSAAPALADKAHRHGAARMDLAVEGRGVEIELEVPLADLVAFEHAPETDAQREAVMVAAAIMHDAGRLFTFPAEADCSPERISLESEVVDGELLAAPGAHAHGAKGKTGRHDGHEKAEEVHADLDAEWIFICRNPEKLKSIEVGLFKHFPSLQEIAVQMLTPAGQGAAELTPQSSVIRW
jgi:hypothetical protein